MASWVTKPVPELSIPIMSGRMFAIRPGVVAITFTRPEPAAPPPRRPLPVSRVKVPRLVVEAATKVPKVIVLPAVPAVKFQRLAPSKLVTAVAPVPSASVTALLPPMKLRIPPRFDRARSEVAVWMLVVPPRRLARTLVLLSRVRAPPSARMVVTNPTRAAEPLRITEPLLT